MYLLISDFLAFDNLKLRSTLENNLNNISKMVYIASNFDDYERNKKYSNKIKNILEEIVHNQIDLTIIDSRLTSNQMNHAITESDILFLAGGNTKQQFDFIKHYQIDSAIISKKNIIGMSAGAINLTTNIFLPSQFDQFVEKDISYKGLSILDFVVYPHYEEIDNDMYNNIINKYDKSLIFFIKNSGYLYLRQENIIAYDCCLEGSLCNIISMH